ncbi:ImmA/IrrE family metallo-endopeptidase [Paramicrobacterium humi]|uniref:ImmA/IrrE family metallo-endopeptidase n=1 Tax=Paramicrobacterium humi TaxID=640635 RepID=UPI000B851669|nr:ImmA/IrrE family metallo-endopeptidase [Microbacterium humi]
MSGRKRTVRALIPNASGVVILENDAQPLTRRRTSMCHELAHVILEHQFGVSFPTRASVGWVATKKLKPTGSPGTMLIPNDGAFRLARASATDEETADAYNVSLGIAPGE